MKKKTIIAATVTACLALCAAVWPQAETVKETPIPNETTIVSAPKATVEELKTEIEITPPAEKEKAAILQPEQVEPASPEPEPAPTETPAAPEVQSTPEQESATEPAPETVTDQTAIEPQSGDMVYVEGFGWIESQGPNHVEYAEDMYENGNKIGIMG